MDIQTFTLTMVLAFFSTSQPKLANAQDAFSCIEELSNDEVEYRIRHIEQTFRDGKRKAAGWRYAWMSGFLLLGAATTYFAVEAALPDENGNTKPWDVFANAYLAAGSYIVALTHAAIPAPDVWGLKRISRMPAGTDEERRAKLRYATETLEQSAFIEEFMGGPLGAVTGVVFGVVGGSVKAAKWPGKTPGTTAVLFVLPPLISTANILTAPRHSIEGWESYRGIACSSRYYDKGSESPALDFSLNPMGSSFAVTF